MFYAHSAKQRKHWEPLRNHLQRVAERAAEYARELDAADEGYLTGLLHDLGKYSEMFTARLERRISGLDHWSAGAWTALMERRALGRAAALAIQGHHIGLQQDDPDSLRGLDLAKLAVRHPMGLRVTEDDSATLLRRLRDDGLDLPTLHATVYDSAVPACSRMLDVRMLFSALVDADFIETEAHFNMGPDGQHCYRAEGPALRPAEALAVVQKAIEALAEEGAGQVARDVLQVRADLLRACLGAGAGPRGLYTLTAPTGSGKTLSMLAFALRHATTHNLRRVVVVIPYLSIIDQTAAIYRGILTPPSFGAAYIIEDHSLTGGRPEQTAGDPDDENPVRREERLLAENWDAPVVVTTSVQFLESLFAASPRACRKLHRLAGSVVLLDEVQTLPARLAVPTLGAMSRLAERYGATIVFATATQPAFDHLDARVRTMAVSGWSPGELVAPELRLFDRIRRTRVRWESEPLSWEALADSLTQHRQALCVVNLKRHALALTERLQAMATPGLYHLSTNMCPAHRRWALDQVRARLDPQDPQPCIVVSTQCVEAGVDLDFPVVYRAYAPLDAIAQAAGRCNRNGKRAVGDVIVFAPEDEAYPDSAYRQAAQVTRLLLRERGTLDIHAPEVFRAYYTTLYDLARPTDPVRGSAADAIDALERRDFAAVAAAYRVIEQDTVSLVVPYDPATFSRLRRSLHDSGGLTTSWIRDARAQAVGLYRNAAGKRPDMEHVPFRGGGESEEWFLAISPPLRYDPLVGLLDAEGVWIA